MKKVSIIYWSKGGNVETLANIIADAATELGAQVVAKDVVDAEVADVVQADAIALGSPSMNKNKIEQREMEPYIRKLELLNNKGKKLVLFGSYGWDDGEFINEWEKRMKKCEFEVIGHIAVRETPRKEEVRIAQELGRQLAK